MSKELEQIKILDEVKDLISKKHNDYQNPHSRIKQADYYPSGLKSIIDLLNMKLLRIISLVETCENDSSKILENTNKIEDSLKDMIAYGSIAAAYSRGKINGQDPNKDFLNRASKK